MGSAAEIEHAARQDRFQPTTRSASRPRTRWCTALSLQVVQRANNALFFIKANNPVVTALAFNASSIDTIRGLAPLPGRAGESGCAIHV